ncbi:hypothetical protein L3X38_013806 [Prunus dulcis]|uniref:Uncharacterized protein n=1 Tax=Prunus dulcis TaxID=3755 RepID=A0AAD4WM73_PRUDU|nr:hypothetical protein L3X38_013806 [Prunus dulcis]
MRPTISDFRSESSYKFNKAYSTRHISLVLIEPSDLSPSQDRTAIASSNPGIIDSEYPVLRFFIRKFLHEPRGAIPIRLSNDNPFKIRAYRRAQDDKDKILEPNGPTPSGPRFATSRR